MAGLKAVYNNVNDLYRDLAQLGISKDHWINQEAIRFKKRGAFERTNVHLRHVPTRLEKISFDCECGRTFKPDWLKKTYPATCFYLGNSKYLNQKQVNVKCPYCCKSQAVEFPSLVRSRSVSIYGDEAFRTVSNRNILTYSFVYFKDSQSERRFREGFRKIKAAISPSVSPVDWTLHLKELMSGDCRKKAPQFERLDKSDLVGHINSLLDLIASYTNSDELTIFSAIGICEGHNLKGKIFQEAKSQIYASALLPIIDELTGNSFSPEFYFERTGSDGWAKNFIDGARLTLVWPYLTRGVPVKSPEFVAPDHHFLLEIADVVSYLMARSLYLVFNEVSSPADKEFDPAQFGKIRYVITTPDGGYGLWTRKKFPVPKVFRGTSLESRAIRFLGP